MEVYRIGEMFSVGLRRKIQKRLRYAGLSLTAEEYLGWVFLVSLLTFILLLPLNPLLAILLPSLFFFSSLYAPLYLGYIRSQRAESELPFFLRSLSTLLRGDIDPLTSLDLASVGRPTLRGSVLNVLSLHDSGLPLPRAFQREAETYLSPRVEKSLLMVSSVIESGHGVDALERYAETLLHSKRLEMKEFSSKLATYTLVFIALTALVPSILLSYSVLFPVVFGEPLDPALLSFVLFFGVPLVSLLTLLYIGRRSV